MNQSNVAKESIEYNEFGERLYRDTSGVKCNLRGMLRREPEWLLSRFAAMETGLGELRDILDGESQSERGK